MVIPASAGSTRRRESESRVVLLAGEALFLRGGYDAAVFDEAGGGVVVVRRDAQDAGWQKRRSVLEQRVDERRERARLREDQEDPDQHEHEHERREPYFFSWRSRPQNSTSTRVLLIPSQYIRE